MERVERVESHDSGEIMKREPFKDSEEKILETFRREGLRRVDERKVCTDKKKNSRERVLNKCHVTST